MYKILIIEDDKNIAELERDYLEINGFEAEIRNDGISGLEEADSGKYDLIVLDLMLPIIDGFEICKTIRSKLDIPMIVVSARTEDIDKIRVLGLGADDYMTKPFSPAELVARVKSHISRYNRLVNKTEIIEELSIKGLVINSLSHRVYVDGEEVILTTKEFEMLYFLAMNPNIVFSKELLFERIWGEDYYGDIGTIAVHIQKIRKKIEKDSANPIYIETVWGSGYRFNK